MVNTAEPTHPSSGEILLGLWPQVRARLRPAHPWELPASSGVSDMRMVEFWRIEKAGWAGAGVAMLDDLGWFRPLANPDLLGRFLYVFGSQSASTDREVIAWYREAGPLWETAVLEGQELPRWAERLEPEQREQLAPEVRAGYAEPLWWVREQALELQACYDLWAALRRGQTEALRALLGGGVPEGKVPADIYLLAGRLVRDLVDESEVGTGRAGSFSITTEPATPHRRLRPLSNEECRRWARIVLARRLNAAERKSWREWLLPEEALVWERLDEEERAQALIEGADLVRSPHFEGLTTALSLLLGRLVEQGLVLPQCQGCHRLFHPSRKGQRYCTSRCGDTDRQRRIYRPGKRARAKAQGGDSRGRANDG